MPATVKHGALVHKDAGPARGSPLPARVVAVLGPGATFQGLAATLLPIYAGATGAKPLTADELANGLVVYNRDLLPAGTWGNHQVGLCLPLPIEIDAATLVAARRLRVHRADEARGLAADRLFAVVDVGRDLRDVGRNILFRDRVRLSTDLAFSDG